MSGVGSYLRSLLLRARGSSSKVSRKPAAPKLQCDGLQPAALLDAFYNFKQIGPFIQGVPGSHTLTRKDLWALSYKRLRDASAHQPLRLEQVASCNVLQQQEAARRQACLDLLGFSCESYIMPFQAEHMLARLSQQAQPAQFQTLGQPARTKGLAQPATKKGLDGCDVETQIGGGDLARWIGKPCNESCGEGIRILSEDSSREAVALHQGRYQEAQAARILAASHIRTDSSSTDFSEAEVLSEYLSNPFLIYGRKFDLRLYVALTIQETTDPRAGSSSVSHGSTMLTPRAFLYCDGMARFATKPYSNILTKGPSDKFAHLTNYSVNSESSEFKETNEDDVKGASNADSHKWSFQATSVHLANLLGTRALEKISADIDSTVSNALLLGMPEINEAIRNRQCKNAPKSYFQLVGFDLLLTDDLSIKLIEIQEQPSLLPTSTFDLHLKTALIEGLQRMLSDIQSPLVLSSSPIPLFSVATVPSSSTSPSPSPLQHSDKFPPLELPYPFGWRELPLMARSDYALVFDALDSYRRLHQCVDTTRYRRHIEDSRRDDSFDNLMYLTEHTNNTQNMGL
eukprot:gb/GEZN01003378.1/.p1 GENE.gb/GEZN01003378.1/~~gb/GEZN01003378.1/.p1  ORF type:complete len:571 (-),score=72.98 gb/GEZN01003378.1/:424-2136(-)